MLLLLRHAQQLRKAHVMSTSSSSAGNALSNKMLPAEALAMDWLSHLTQPLSKGHDQGGGSGEVTGVAFRTHLVAVATNSA